MIQKEKKYSINLKFLHISLNLDELHDLDQEKSILEELNSIMIKSCIKNNNLGASAGPLNKYNSLEFNSSLDTNSGEYLNSSQLIKKKLDLESKIELLTKNIFELRSVNTKLLEKITTRLAMCDKQIQILHRHLSLLSNLTKFRIIKENNLKFLLFPENSEYDENSSNIIGYLYNINFNKIIPIFNNNFRSSCLDSIQFFWSSLLKLLTN